MNPSEGRRLAEARRQLPQMALRLGSREAVQEEFLRLHPDLLAALGESLLRRWIWESLRQLKEPSLAEIGGQLPLFGQFGDEIRTRDEWTQDHYRAYYRRYSNAATRNAAKLRVLAAEFESRFGHGIDEARAA
jgi:hypothetical protein